MSQTQLYLTPRMSPVPPGWVTGNRGVLQRLVCLVRRLNEHLFALFSMQNVTRCHLGLCTEWGPKLTGACTTHVEDKHHVLIARVFTLLSDVLLEQFDYTNNKCASKNVFLKAFEAQV